MAATISTSLLNKCVSHTPSIPHISKSGNAVSPAASKNVKPPTCVKCRSNRPVVSQATVQDISGHMCAATSPDKIQFASVSGAQTSTAPSNLIVFPAAVGAGILGAAAVSVLMGNSAPATGPVTATGKPVIPAVPRATQASPAALDTMAAAFPTAVQEEAFVKAVAKELFSLGFIKDNNISLVNTCRDEVCRPLVNLIDREFGLSFNISGLGGLLNCGKTGFKAAMSHSPEFKCDTAGIVKERYIFFAFPHVSVGETGEVGSLLRRGRGKPSSACGALIAIRGDILQGGDIVDDSDDKEYVLLKSKVVSKVGGKNPSLVDVTNAALKAITEDLERYIREVVDPATADYAVITGVQIHSGNQVPGEAFRIERTCDYIAPDTMYAVINGQRYNLQIETGPKMLSRP